MNAIQFSNARASQAINATRGLHTNTHSWPHVFVSRSLSHWLFSIRFHSACARLEKHLKIRWNAINLMNTVVSNTLTLRELGRSSVSIELIVIFLRKNSKRHEKNTYIHQAVVVAAAAALPTQMIRYYSSQNKHGEMIIKRNGAILFSSCLADGRRTTEFNKRLIGMRCGARPCAIADKVRKRRNSFNSIFVTAFDRFRFISE